MTNKTDKALSLFNKGFIKESLAIFKTFRIGFTREEKRIIEIASECLNGRSLFYEQLGFDVNSILSQSKSIIQIKYKS